MELDMTRSNVYAVNAQGNDYDDGSYWVQTMSAFNNSRAFDLLSANENPRYFLYLIILS